MCTDDTGVSFRSVVSAISSTVDLVNDNVTKHHLRVAYIASEIGRVMNLDKQKFRDLVTAAAMHDIGALSHEGEASLLHHKIDENVAEHADVGFMLLKDFPPMSRIAEIIRFHHHQWSDGKGHMDNNVIVPFEGHIIHLADCIEMLVNPGLHVLSQKENIINTIKSQSGDMFAPDAVDAWLKIASNDYFWLELDHADLSKIIDSSYPEEVKELTFSELVQFSKIISYIIDFRSPYTAAHSSGVAEVAYNIGRVMGMPDCNCRMLRIAGYLHDLGKISIPSSVLDKNGRLDDEEFAVMRSHSYHTYRILNNISGFDKLAKCAGHHHERLDGSGYPFGLKGDEISRGARIVAVADVFTAVTEDRPYRCGMPLSKARDILVDMAEGGKLDREVVDSLAKNLLPIYRERKTSQEAAMRDYVKVNRNNSRSFSGNIR